MHLAEREGFEPPIRLPVCRISSAVHSTTLPPLQTMTKQKNLVTMQNSEMHICYQSLSGACLGPPAGRRQQSWHLSASRRVPKPLLHKCDYISQKPQAASIRGAGQTHLMGTVEDLTLPQNNKSQCKARYRANTCRALGAQGRN
jgi:hypothetical protein